MRSPSRRLPCRAGGGTFRREAAVIGGRARFRLLDVILIVLGLAAAAYGLYRVRTVALMYLLLTLSLSLAVSALEKRLRRSD